MDQIHVQVQIPIEGKKIKNAWLSNYYSDISTNFKLLFLSSCLQPAHNKMKFIISKLNTLYPDINIKYDSISIELLVDIVLAYQRKTIKESPQGRINVF